MKGIGYIAKFSSFSSYPNFLKPTHSAQSNYLNLIWVLRSTYHINTMRSSEVAVEKVVILHILVFYCYKYKCYVKYYKIFIDMHILCSYTIIIKKA